MAATSWGRGSAGGAEPIVRVEKLRIRPMPHCLQHARQNLWPFYALVPARCGEIRYTSAYLLFLPAAFSLPSTVHSHSS